MRPTAWLTSTNLRLKGFCFRDGAGNWGRWKAWFFFASRNYLEWTNERDAHSFTITFNLPAFNYDEWWRIIKFNKSANDLKLTWCCNLNVNSFHPLASTALHINHQFVVVVWELQYHRIWFSFISNLPLFTLNCVVYRCSLPHTSCAVFSFLLLRSIIQPETITRSSQFFSPPAYNAMLMCVYMANVFNVAAMCAHMWWFFFRLFHVYFISKMKKKRERVER